MYGEFCVTKIFTNADDIGLSINSLLVYTVQQMARTTQRKKWKK